MRAGGLVTGMMAALCVATGAAGAQETLCKPQALETMDTVGKLPRPALPEAPLDG